MRSLVIALVGLIALGSFTTTARADDENKQQSGPVNGVLIDQHCGQKQMEKANPQQAAEKHDKACAIKCADSGYAVISGKTMYKFDDNGNKLAKDYLANHDSTNVIVEGTPKSDGTMEVTAIKPAKEG